MIIHLDPMGHGLVESQVTILGLSQTSLNFGFGELIDKIEDIIEIIEDFI